MQIDRDKALAEAGELALTVWLQERAIAALEAERDELRAEVGRLQDKAAGPGPWEGLPGITFNQLPTAYTATAGAGTLNLSWPEGRSYATSTASGTTAP